MYKKIYNLAKQKDLDFIAYDDSEVDYIIDKIEKLENYKNELTEIKPLFITEINFYIDFLNKVIKYEKYNNLKINIDLLYNEINIFKTLKGDHKQTLFYNTRIDREITDILKYKFILDYFLSEVKKINSNFITIENI